MGYVRGWWALVLLIGLGGCSQGPSNESTSPIEEVALWESSDRARQLCLDWNFDTGVVPSDILVSADSSLGAVAEFEERLGFEEGEDLNLVDADASTYVAMCLIGGSIPNERGADSMLYYQMQSGAGLVLDIE